MVDETQYYDVIRGPGLYRCADGTTVRIIHFRAGYAAEFDAAQNIHVWMMEGEHGISYRPDGGSIARGPNKRVVAGPLPEEPRPGETWYVRFALDRPDVRKAEVLDVTEHTVKLRVSDFPVDSTRRVVRDAVEFVEYVS